MFGTSGVRGPVGETITGRLALDVGRALAVDRDRVVVGRDPRASGAALADALIAGLCESGADIVDLGLTATPTVARAVEWEDADAGVAVTASHNPPADNGLKLWQPSGQAFDTSRRETIAARVREERFAPAAWDGFGARRRADASERHVDAFVGAVTDTADGAGVDDTGGANAVALDGSLSVIVDLGNGAGGVAVRGLEALGCTVETLNAQPDGAFPGRPSEPTAENCASLCALVAASDADLGVALDGDADRMRAVDENGQFVDGDVLLALFAREAVRESTVVEPRVAAPVNVSLAVDDALADVGAGVVRTRVGDVSVAERATESEVVFGGEYSGSWIWPTETLCPDGPLAACTLAALASGDSLSELAAAIETYPTRREAIETGEKAAAMECVERRVAERYGDVATLDGVRVDLGDAWFLVRASGTQPLVRVSAEARETGRAEEAFGTARELVEDAVGAVEDAE
jgi:phosphoglucosamine mutase